ncbi:MAG TPA: tRNA (N6-isopentenyl adenosine(37)-C2)-methylthiotransferase MiaB [Sphingobacteriaceae bacterium]|nr:tRNA (N6-isopentenyl adenosine(37)-C2)-methylthiotransferase MiaB [Sphingobacteriaceae bacterium]
MAERTFSVFQFIDGQTALREQLHGLGFRSVEGQWINDAGLTPAQWAHGFTPEQTPRSHIITYGCQMNEHDSEILAGQLQLMGYVPTQRYEDADLILLNTCAIRETAEEKVYGTIGWLKSLKAVRPEVILGLCGCMAQEEVTVRRIKRTAPHVDLVFGTHNIHRLPELIGRVRREEATVIDVWKGSKEVVEHLPAVREDGRRAWVTIQYGCDKFCTFCIVPYVRGRERSRRPEDILAEVQDLADRGYVEVTLLGQTVSSYGQDFVDRQYDFADLLRDLDTVAGIRWLRFTSPYPGDFDERLIRQMGETKKLCKHIHFPMQSGSNRVLHRMNRRYTREQYLERVARLREAVPGISITTDIIVGFPGETEEDFQQTLDLVEQVRFDNAFTFKFSPRTGTVGAKWEEQWGIDEDVKQERLERLMAVQNRISLEQNQAYQGRRVEVLIEGPSPKNPDVLTARTSTNRVVLVPGPAHLAGTFAQVDITEARTWTLVGRLVEEPAAPAPGSRLVSTLP